MCVDAIWNEENGATYIIQLVKLSTCIELLSTEYLDYYGIECIVRYLSANM